MPTAWSFLHTTSPTFASNEGYSDIPTSIYQWDSTVHNHDRPAVGDLVVIRGRKSTYGSGYIESLDISSGEKNRNRCPKCNRTDISIRKVKEPRFRCGNCHAEFDSQVVEKVAVKKYAASYGSTWQPKEIDVNQLEPHLLNTNRLYSIRQADAEAVERLIGRAGVIGSIPSLLSFFEPKDNPAAREQILRSITLRRGQSVFRNSLLVAYKGACAVTGTSETCALEAAHIKPYSEDGTNKLSNGLLLRCDWHTMFDLGYWTLDSNRKIRLSAQIMSSEYRRFDGQPIRDPQSPADSPSNESLEYHRTNTFID